MKYFNGEIANKKLSDFNQYDNKLVKYQDRLNHVNNTINEDGEYAHEFFAEYFSNYYNATPSQDGYLAEDDAVCKLIEGMGTYLINAQDITSYRKVEYRFWRDEMDFRRFKESENINESAINVGEDSNVEVIDMFVDKKNDKNQKIVKDISVNSKDVKDVPEIKQLQLAVDFLKSNAGIKSVREHAETLLNAPNLSDKEMGRLRYIAKNTERYIDSYVKMLREDQVLIKKAIKRPIEFKAVLKDEGAPNKLEDFDFMEKKDVEALLPFLSSDDLMTDLGTLAYDLNNLIDETKLSNRESEIVNYLRRGYSTSEVQDVLGIRKQNMKTYIGRIAEKVVKTYEKQVFEYRERERQKKNK